MKWDAGEILSLFSGINFNKDFGQHILKNPLVVNSMVEKVCFIHEVQRQLTFFSVYYVV